MLSFRFATSNDTDLFFAWANDAVTRENSYQTAQITYSDHVAWFKKKISNLHDFLFVFENEEHVAVGQVRIDTKEADQAIISISVDANYRKKGYATDMIKMASDAFLNEHPGYTILAYIFKTNQASYHCFLKADYKYLKEEKIKDIPSYILYKA